jgi:hypothetical protein
MNPAPGNLKLVRHSHSASHGECSIEVDVELREREILRFSYRTAGDVRSIELPELASSMRQDNLWRYTCFEMFLADRSGAYFEFNFSPSTQWAAYRFDAYRQGLTDLQLQSAPRISTEVTSDFLRIDATVDLRGHRTSDGPGRTRMALAAVIKDLDGEFSYWALRHPDGKPDFHHADGFVVALTDNGKQ